ncbi:diaminopimelate epimerase [Coprococcus comes]|uniref:diaminopimelate epimerase n=1 Tax=Coprococcus comes TaxID=410072 RepID=UPI001570496A|nr:diaminopimelate epimerase [Coprococcus comes]NSD15394.1 diaminopimelate epimerase [Coprococcus comes]NSG44172.1 diaminopimelate epimerase [Coprococcus comes]
MIFTKMHGLGNDYVCINCFRERVEDPSGFARTLCDRHYGIGADGLILICPSKVSDFKMEIYNSDGSVAGMCGNGIRCLGKYVYDYRLTGKETLSIETKSGIRNMYLHIQDGKACGAMVDMGVPRLNAHSIPILSEKDLVINEPIEVQEKNYRMTGISMGNPHAVIFSEEINGISLEETGRELEFHPRFPERANIEFCHVTARDRMEIRVWERGVGETLACGTGACAAVVASVLNDLTDEEVIVKLLGGELSVRWDRKVNHVFLKGPAVKVFDGVL